MTLDVPSTPAADLRLRRFRPLWASKEVDASPALAYLRPAQMVELSPADAERLGVADGEHVEVRQNGHAIGGRAVIRAAVPAGSVFVAEGISDNPGNLLTGLEVSLRGSGRRADEAQAQTGVAGPAAGDAGEMRSNDPGMMSAPRTGFTQREGS